MSVNSSADDIYSSDSEVNCFDESDDDENDILDSDDDHEENIKPQIEPFPHQSLSPHQLQTRMRQQVDEIVSILSIQTPIASLMLRHFNWDREHLIEAFMESSEALFQRFGIVKPSTAPRHIKRRRIDPFETPFDCEICCSEVTDVNDGFMADPCYHKYCTACWDAYISNQILTEGKTSIYCMSESCSTILEDSVIEKLAGLACLERYSELITRSYVASSRDLRFCPYPACDQTISSSIPKKSPRHESAVPTVVCTLGHEFCFGCGLDQSHSPIVCSLASRFLSATSADAGTAAWLKANTRPCPFNCGNNIEKNGGCNRILCTTCQKNFCFLCLSDWDVHGYEGNGTCSAWKEIPVTDDQSKARIDLDRWLHYFDRFKNHEASAQLDEELYEKTKEKMVDVQNSSSLSWIETQFMRSAVDELTKCRRTLKWTYAFAFYLESGNEKEIFEDIQSRLEIAVENLSQLLEEPIETGTIVSLRQRMLDKTVFVQKQHDILGKDTAQGLRDGRWIWTENN